MSRAALQNKTNILIGIIIVFVLGGTWFGYIRQRQAEPVRPAVPVTTPTVQKLDKVSYQGVDGQTALALLRQKHHITTKTYDFGELVTAIDGVSGNGPKYWSFYINGKMAEAGASTYQTKATDKIEWRLQ
jgi:hypothetical protein